MHYKLEQTHNMDYEPSIVWTMKSNCIHIYIYTYVCDAYIYIWFILKILTITSSYGLLTMNLIFIGCEYPLFSVLNRGTSDARKLLLGWWKGYSLHMVGSIYPSHWRTHIFQPVYIYSIHIHQDMYKQPTLGTMPVCQGQNREGLYAVRSVARQENAFWNQPWTALIRTKNRTSTMFAIPQSWFFRSTSRACSFLLVTGYCV